MSRNLLQSSPKPNREPLLQIERLVSIHKSRKLQAPISRDRRLNLREMIYRIVIELRHDSDLRGHMNTFLYQVEDIGKACEYILVLILSELKNQEELAGV